MIPTLILDLDNTIIGNITYQLLTFNLCKKASKLPPITNCYNEKSGIIRSGFVQFIRTLLMAIPDVKIYVYTASQKEWALKEIKWIEKCCNIKFDRPILTRTDCLEINGDFYKSINKINKKIKHITAENLLIIDNNDIFIDCKENFIKCPSYNYIYFVDMWKSIPEKCLNNDDVSNFILKLIKDGYMNPFNVVDINTDMDKSIKSLDWFQKKLVKINKNNKKYLNDNFWKQLTKVILNYNVKDLNSIKQHIRLE